MADLQITIKDATGSTKNLLARDNGDTTVTPYHTEDNAQRTALLAALATLSTAANQTASKATLDGISAKVATATNQATANTSLAMIATNTAGGSTAARQDEARAELRAVQGVEPITPGTDGTPRRGLLIVCTSPGDVRIKLADDSLLTIPVGVGLTILPLAVKTVVAAATTATATYWGTL